MKYLYSWDVTHTFGTAMILLVASVHYLLSHRLDGKKGMLSPRVQQRLWWLDPFEWVLLCIALGVVSWSVIVPLITGWFFARYYVPGLLAGLTIALGLQALSARKRILSLREATAVENTRNRSILGTKTERRSFLKGLTVGLAVSITLAVLCLWVVLSLTQPAIRSRLPLTFK
jgi:hypothetical protein